MASSALARRVALMLAMSSLGLLGISCDSSRDMAARKGSARKQILRELRTALYSYERDYGNLPYSEHGDSCALYQLRQFIDPGAVAGLSNGTLVFNEDNCSLDGVPYTFLNRPELKREQLSPDVVLLAEQRPDGQWVLLAGGDIMFTKRRVGPGDIYTSGE